jgi:DnaJ-class molecular chaperone
MSNEEHCYTCRGTGIVQASWGVGYSGVCQRCSGAGKIYTANGKEVSKDDYGYDQLDQIGYWDD